MTDVQPGGQRRLDHVLSAGYLADLEQVGDDELRSRRGEAEQEEVDLSYVRRLLQGRMDVVRAEQMSRTDGGGSVVDRLTAILADSPHEDPGSAGAGRYTTRQPSSVDQHRRRVERLVADVDIDDVQSRTDEEIAAALAVYALEEHAVSEVRRSVQQVVERCDREFARRAEASGIGGHQETS